MFPIVGEAGGKNLDRLDRYYPFHKPPSLTVRVERFYRYWVIEAN